MRERWSARRKEGVVMAFEPARSGLRGSLMLGAPGGCGDRRHKGPPKRHAIASPKKDGHRQRRGDAATSRSIASCTRFAASGRAERPPLSH
jgi:hypothetical protein